MATKAKAGKKSVGEERIGKVAPDLEAAKTEARNVCFRTARCEEASTFSREKYIPCGAPASAAVWHKKDRRMCVMCEACADHNVKNRGGVLLAQDTAYLESAQRPTEVKHGPALAIRAEDVLSIKVLRQQKFMLESRVKNIDAQLKPMEDAVIVALGAGVPLGPGCPPCAVKVDERRVPKWKEIACGLAKRFLNVTVEVYEVTVLSETEAKQYRRLIINGEK